MPPQKNLKILLTNVWKREKRKKKDEKRKKRRKEREVEKRKRKREFNSRKPLKIKTILKNSCILHLYFSKKCLNQNCEKFYKIYSKISLENHEFINVPFTISTITYPPYLKA